jgi:hypothetical protein
VLRWGEGAGRGPVAPPIAEISAGVGVAATVTKVCATVAVTAAMIGGASQVLPAGHAKHLPSRRGPTAADRRAPDSSALAGIGASGSLATTGAAAAPVPGAASTQRDSPNRPAVLDRRGQQQQQQQQEHGSGPSAGAHNQSHQTGVDQPATTSLNAGPGASGANRGAGPQGPRSTAGGQRGSVAQQTGSQGTSGAQGTNQP